MRLSVVLALLTLSATASAVPTQVTHQGRLMDSTGAALDGPHTLDVTLYDAQTDGNAVWTESLADVAFDAGYFNAVLGSTTPLDSSVFSGGTLYLGLSVDGGTELGDRIAVLSVPYAISANTSTNLSGGVVDATEVRINGNVVIDDSGIVGGGDTLSDLSCTDGQVAKQEAGSWVCADDGINTDASALSSGTVPLAQLPVGTGDTEVAAGNHSHSAADVGALSATGDVAVDGNLTASGLLTLSSADVACDSTTAGSLRWFDDALQLCDGSAWAAVGAGAATSNERYVIYMGIDTRQIDMVGKGSEPRLKIPFCTVGTGDNEISGWSGIDVAETIVGWGYDINSTGLEHCRNGDKTNPTPASYGCVRIEVKDFGYQGSHDTYGISCLNNNRSAYSYWTFNAQNGTFADSLGNTDTGWSAPQNVGEVTCTDGNWVCVEKVR